MASFRISGLTKSYGSNVIVDDLDLEIEEGEFLVLLGPSGCGKTTTLRCLAGLETPERGRIEFKGDPVFDSSARVNVPAHKRRIGMVFQSYALWPNMTVRKNIAYPLKVRRMKEALAAGRVEEAAAMVHCEHLLDRYPSQLSGGQQQRIAVARGLAARPDLVLFDEPLSNLDARLRDQVRTEIHRLHESLGFGAVFVTHDQSEAFALGDKLAIMREGRIEQLGTPQDVFQRPATDYVAGFIGMANRLELRRTGAGWQTKGGVDVLVARDVPDAPALVARLWPDDVSLHRDSESVPTGAVAIKAELLAAEFGGRQYHVTVGANGEEFRLQADSATHGSWLRTATEGCPVLISFRAEALHVYSEGGERALASPGSAG
ncbi:ATP-binding cassette domain-containing protein [Pimelobacter simplex]|uniref:Maltose/maltodextrin transport ATP-binding protein MalK n=1 Tax=Nocardioides simplex TaxID=2045 RepID=A0A0A1DKI9_NOCSI|nr:ABC transporter ATP-binding protein [Pimelobacter simplex]AIY15880.1 Maltose/maltodextrin transport ATP-binding protein MalK [Pimelobacter simplex]MCG8154515.1 ATP-binding cassette domain-containing protein [Pimelobacter simplex]GEB12564.1 ABC transporter ATP-binding protein [Pimelobacter simplex]SFM93236.1 iron(III) transport system ATP-binding protein [Pimelobacter simplex]